MAKIFYSLTKRYIFFRFIAHFLLLNILNKLFGFRTCSVKMTGFCKGKSKRSSSRYLCLHQESMESSSFDSHYVENPNSNPGGKKYA